MDWAFHESQIRFDIAQSAKNMSGYSSTRQEFCKIGLFAGNPQKYHLRSVGFKNSGI